MKKVGATLEKRLDATVTATIRLTIGGFVALLAASYIFKFDGLVTLLLLTAGLFICTMLILTKGAMTGKRYKNGAKHRRERWFPIFFKKNESLADEAFKNWQ